MQHTRFVLGRHRDDDTRSGWISGLDDEKGKQHPTFGGLRIGKPLNERKPNEPSATFFEITAAKAIKALRSFRQCLEYWRKRY